MLEYAFGMNPTLANRKQLDGTNTGALPLISRTGTTIANRVLQVEYRRRKNPAALGLTYVVQFGTTTTSFSDSAQAESVISIDASWERVTVKDTALAPAEEKCFGRVKVTLVP